MPRVPREGACEVWVAPPPAAGRARRALRRCGAVALLDGAVYAYCPNYLNGEDGGGCRLNPVLGIGPRDGTTVWNSSPASPAPPSGPGA